MVEGKGLDEVVACRIGEYVKLSGSFGLLEKLMSDQRLTAVASAMAGLEDMKLLLHYCELFVVLNKVSVRSVMVAIRNISRLLAREKLVPFPNMKTLHHFLWCVLGVTQVSFDLSLARGLDYYTGVIYEAILTGMCHSHAAECTRD